MLLNKERGEHGGSFDPAYSPSYCTFLATDINEDAARVTQNTAKENKVQFKLLGVSAE